LVEIGWRKGGGGAHASTADLRPSRPDLAEGTPDPAQQVGDPAAGRRPQTLTHHRSTGREGRWRRKGGEKVSAAAVLAFSRIVGVGLQWRPGMEN
jgi:hypothetical protein